MAKVSSYLVAFIISLLTTIMSYGQSKTVAVDHFDKVIISPHIQVTFEAGDSEGVTIKNAYLPEEKINIEVVGKTLRIYLDGAKMVTKQEKYSDNGWKGKRSIYKGTQVVAKVTYRDIKELSIRGEEEIICKSTIERDDFKLKIYGESRMTMNSIKLNSLDVAIYGESYLEIKEGTVDNQKYTVYGEGHVNTLGLANENTRITAFGEGNFRISVSDKLKVTAYGEAIVAYNGNPTIGKGIIIGKARIKKMN